MRKSAENNFLILSITKWTQHLDGFVNKFLAFRRLIENIILRKIVSSKVEFKSLTESEKVLMSKKGEKKCKVIVFFTAFFNY